MNDSDEDLTVSWWQSLHAVCFAMAIHHSDLQEAYTVDDGDDDNDDTAADDTNDGDDNGDGDNDDETDSDIDDESVWLK